MLEKKERKPQEYISPSSINTFYKCPRSYFYNYISKLPQPPSIHLVKGTIVHKVLEDFFRKYYNKPMEQCKILLDAAWKQNKRKLKMLELEKEEEEAEYQDCMNCISEYIEGFQRKIKNLIHCKKAENEQHAYYLLKPKFKELYVVNEALKCRGYIDRISEDYNGVLTIADYKTSSKYGVGLPEDYKRQISIYSLLYLIQEKRMPDFTSVIFLRYGEEYLLEVTPSLLKYAHSQITYAYKQTRSANIRDYPKKEGNLCRWCPYQDICSGRQDWEQLARVEKLKKLLSKKEDKK